LTRLLNTALQLAQTSRPQDGSTAAYIFRFLLRLPSFNDVLRAHFMSSSPAGRDDDDDDDDDGDDSYYRCVRLLLQLLQRQLEVATVNLLQASDL